MNLFLVVMSVTAVVAKFLAVARLHSIRIFLQRWLRHPLVQPHEVISLQAFGIGGREINRGTSRPSRCIHPISVTGGKSFCRGVLEVEEARPYFAPPQLSFPCEHECSAKSAAYDVALRTELSPLVPITLHRRSTN